MTNAELAEYYDRTHDVSEFDLEHPEPVTPWRGQRLEVSISVRFTPSEIDLLRERAQQAGMKVTAFIRALAMQHQDGEVIDRAGLARIVESVSEELAEVRRQLTQV